MSGQHARVWVAGHDCTGDTIAELSIKGGRGDFTDTPDAVSLSLSVEWPGWASLPVIGDPVHVAGWLPGMEEETRRALFSGHVTDVAFEDAVVSLVAVDPSRRLDGVTVGDKPWSYETWQARVERIIGLGAQQLGPQDRAWFGNWSPALNPVAVLDDQYVPWRDVDRQEVLGLLEEMFAPVGIVWWFQPDYWMGVSAADPGDWLPGMGASSVLGLLGGGSPSVLGVVPPSMVDADPGPRLWMNLGPTCNQWTVSGPGCEEFAGPPVDGFGWESVAGLPAGARARYGQSSATLDTPFVEMPSQSSTLYKGWPELAQMWLARTGHPTWGADGVVVRLDAQTMQLEDPSTARSVWMGLLSRGPGVCGMTVHLDGLDGSANPGYWVVEGLSITWLVDGWLIEMDPLTDIGVYHGRATVPPRDPRNDVSIAEPLPATIPSGGWLLWPMLHAGGVQGADGGYWRVVAPDLGIVGSPARNLGAGSLVAVPPLPAGLRTVEVQWHPQAPDPGSLTGVKVLRLTVTVVDAPTWADEPAAATWDELPEDETWRDDHA